MKRIEGTTRFSFARLRASTAGLCLGLACLVAAASPAAAQSDINAILGGDGAAPLGAQSQGGAPAPALQSVPQSLQGQTGAHQTEDPSASSFANPQKELWLKSDHPTENLSVISVHPLPGEKCQDVLFDIRPSTRTRHSPSARGTLDFDLDQLCLIGLRNESDKRTIVVRVGEELRTVAIVSDSRLNSGIALGPGREIITPIRPLDIKALTIGVEAVWEDELTAADPNVEAFNLRLTNRSTPGS